MTILRTNTIAGVGTTTFGPLLDGNLEFNSQNYIVLPKGTSTQEGVLRTTADVVGTGGTFYDNLVLAMPFNSATGLTDVSSRNRNPAAYGNVAISTAQSKYYGSSAYFDGSGDYIQLANNADFQFGTGDWTIEFWWNGQPTGSYTAQVSTLIYSTESGTWRVGTRFNSGNEIYFSRGTGSDFTDVRFNVNVNDSNWHHIAFVRSSGVIIPFVDGINRTANLLSGSVSDSNSMTTTNPVKIGYNSRDNAYIEGYLQDLRIYKGLAKYTANFTPPERIAELGVGFKAGQLRYNTDSNKVELYDGSQWTEVQASRPDLNGGARGVFMGGEITPGTLFSNVIDYITISSTGNAQDFGDLQTGRRIGASCASSTRGLYGGGIAASPLSVNNIIDFITISSTGNAQDFGDLSLSRYIHNGSCASSTRGLWGGGYNSPPNSNVIDYVTISSTGNAVDFGDLTQARKSLTALSSPVRGVWGGGDNPATVNTIDYITIATLGNAFDFGDLSLARYSLSSCSNSTRGLFGGGEFSGQTNIIDYITISTVGNAVKFGDLTAARHVLTACSSQTRGVFGGGTNNSNVIDYISISVQGNAVDFGDLSVARQSLSACSNAHGGL